MADVAAHLNFLSLQLQGGNRMITDMYDAVKAFQLKLLLWEAQMPLRKLTHFPCCQTMSNQVNATIFPNIYFADKLTILCAEFTRRFGDFESHKGNLGCYATHL